VSPKNISKGRRNANNVDLNRDFPYIHNFSSTDEPGFWEGRQPETIAYMKHSLEELFPVDAMIHTGDLIISIPLDAHR
jgi:murein tripeptide amidase MpaA